MKAFSNAQQRAVAILRIAVGTIFFSAGFDKAFLSAKPFTAAGFLKFGTAGSPAFAAPVDGVIYNPTHAFWVDLAGNASLMSVINALVVFGELAIGVALILGIATRFAAAMGTLMMVLFFFAAWNLENGIVNEHIAYAVTTAAVGILGAGRFWGLDSVIEKAKVVRTAPRLRWVLG